MSEQHSDFPKTTAKEVVLAAVGGLLAPLIVIALIVNYVIGIQASQIDSDVPTTTSSIQEPGNK